MLVKARYATHFRFFFAAQAFIERHRRSWFIICWRWHSSIATDKILVPVSVSCRTLPNKKGMIREKKGSKNRVTRLTIVIAPVGISSPYVVKERRKVLGDSERDRQQGGQKGAQQGDKKGGQ